jgi:hypothetical protein
MPSHLHLGRSVLRAPRPRIEGCYAGDREYLRNATRTAESLVGAGLLLREDIRAYSIMPSVTGTGS